MWETQFNDLDTRKSRDIWTYSYEQPCIVYWYRENSALMIIIQAQFKAFWQGEKHTVWSGWTNQTKMLLLEDIV